MEYLTLTDDEKHDIQISYLAAQERDHYCHTINKERFETILKDPQVSPDLRRRTQELLSQTKDRLHEVTHYMEKMRAALPETPHREAALTRFQAAQRRAKAEAAAADPPA